jgi:hypothetical protein
MTTAIAMKLTDYGAALFRPAIEPMFKPRQLVAAAFRDSDLERKYRGTDVRNMARVAREIGAEAAFLQYSEQAILAGLFGNLVAAVKTGISAAAPTQTSIATMNAYTYINAGRSAGNSSNCDTTPSSTGFVGVSTPGTSPNYNTYTAPHAFLLTSSSATSMGIASQSIGLAISVGDFVFVQGSATGGGGTTGGQPFWGLNAMYIGLSTATYTSSQSTILAGEPGASNGYTRIGYTGTQVNGAGAVYGIPNTQAVWGTATAASPSVITLAQSLSFAQSTGSWLAGATLNSGFIADALTNGGGNLVAVGALTTPQAVAASGITLSFAVSSITVSLS